MNTVKNIDTNYTSAATAEVLRQQPLLQECETNTSLLKVELPQLKKTEFAHIFKNSS